MRNWIDKVSATVVTVVLILAFLGQSVKVMNQSNIYIKETVGLTQYTTTPESSEYTDNTEWNQQDNTQENSSADYAIEFKDEEILYSSYYLYGQGCLTVELVKEDLEVTTDGAMAASMNNSGIASSQQLLDACFSETEKAELEAGADKEIRVTMKQMVAEGLKDNQYDLLEQAKEEYSSIYKGFQVGSYIKISITKKNDNGKWKNIKKFNNDIKFLIDIPKISQISEAKEYYLIQIRDGGYSITEDEDNYLEILTASVSGAAMCAIGYTLPYAEVTPTVAPTAPPTYWEHLTDGDLCVWHWFMLAFFVIGFTWVLAIESKKIRIVFLSVMSILCIILAILGQCVYDWPFAIGSIIFMILIHVGRSYKKKK